jgi:hypothetical protein
MIDLSHFFEQTPWFSRLWNVQEVGLSQQAYLAWTNIYINFHAFIKTLVFVTQNRDSFNSASKEHQIIRTLTKSMSPYHAVVTSLKTPSIAPFLIASTEGLQASRAHDHVFALHGILTRLGIDLPFPDYSKSSKDVFWEYFTRMVTLPHVTSGLLGQLSGLKESQTVTSWTPDWLTEERILFYPLGNNNKGLRTNQDACDVHLDDSRLRLAVKGVVTDSVVARATFSIVDIFKHSLN